MIGAGRARPHNGLTALHDWKISDASRSTLRVRKKPPILFIGDRITGRSDKHSQPAAPVRHSLECAPETGGEFMVGILLERKRLRFNYDATIAEAAGLITRTRLVFTDEVGLRSLVHPGSRATRKLCRATNL